jgi:hypothetical protein
MTASSRLSLLPAVLVCSLMIVVSLSFKFFSSPTPVAAQECPPVERCPVSCGYDGGQVADGECGFWQCEPTEPCPASPSPAPASPTPGGKKTALGANLTCANDDFEVTLDATDNGNPMPGVKVVFEYDVKRTVYTNQAGRAQAYFTKTLDQTLTAKVENYPDQSLHLDFPECEAAAVATVTELAPTGQTLNWLSWLLVSLGLGLVVVSGYVYFSPKK